MLSVHKLNADRIDYYIQLIIDYYTNNQGENPHAAWMGGAAGLLGLQGQRIDPEHLRNLLKGMDPKGLSRLVRNACKANRMPGFDLTFSAPKSLSYIWSIALPELRAKIEEVFERAVERTIAKIEGETHIRVRNGSNPRKRIASKVAALAVTHHTARPKDDLTRPDPQLHRHILMINTGFAPDGRTGALDGLRILNNKAKVGVDRQFSLRFGQEFRKELADGVKQELGFGIRPTKIRGREGFEIAGVPDFELRRNSKRSKQIREAAPDETHTPGQRRVATIETRHTKSAFEIEPSALFETWRKEAAARGFTAESVEALRTFQERELERERVLERDRSRGFGR